jgi:hypothetical protein
VDRRSFETCRLSESSTKAPGYVNLMTWMVIGEPATIAVPGLETGVGRRSVETCSLSESSTKVPGCVNLMICMVIGEPATIYHLVAERQQQLLAAPR